MEISIVSLWKGGKGCTAHDVVIHPEMLRRIQDSQVLMGFFLTVTLEGIEYKYSISLDRSKNFTSVKLIRIIFFFFYHKINEWIDWVMLKNRKNVGMLQEQHLRTKSRPVEDLGEDAVPGIKKMVSEVSRDEEPKMKESIKK